MDESKRIVMSRVTSLMNWSSHSRFFDFLTQRCWGKFGVRGSRFGKIKMRQKKKVFCVDEEERKDKCGSCVTCQIKHPSILLSISSINFAELLLLGQVYVKAMSLARFFSCQTCHAPRSHIDCAGIWDRGHNKFHLEGSTSSLWVGFE